MVRVVGGLVAEFLECYGGLLNNPINLEALDLDNIRPDHLLHKPLLRKLKCRHSLQPHIYGSFDPYRDSSDVEC
jgi:hypothetical protein